MIAAFWAVVGKIAKKVLAALAGDKKGRKILGYVIGIALFIVLLPVIAVYGLFGWMAGGGATEIIDYNAVCEYIPVEQRSVMEQYESELAAIQTVFVENGLGARDISKAKTIYISCLTGKETEEDFYQRYAECFILQSEEHSIWDNISSAFGISFSDDEKQQFNNLYGG